VVGQDIVRSVVIRKVNAVVINKIMKKKKKKKVKKGY